MGSSGGFLDAEFHVVVLFVLAMQIQGEACCSAVTVYLHRSEGPCPPKVSPFAADESRRLCWVKMAERTQKFWQESKEKEKDAWH